MRSNNFIRVPYVVYYIPTGCFTEESSGTAFSSLAFRRLVYRFYPSFFIFLLTQSIFEIQFRLIKLDLCRLYDGVQMNSSFATKNKECRSSFNTLEAQLDLESNHHHPESKSPALTTKLPRLSFAMIYISFRFKLFKVLNMLTISKNLLKRALI